MRSRAEGGRSERGSGSDFEGFATRVTIKSGIGRVTRESHLRGGLGGRGGGREAASEGESSGHVTSTTRAVGPVPRRWWVCAIAVGRRPIHAPHFYFFPPRRNIRAPCVGARRAVVHLFSVFAATAASTLFPPRLRDATATRARPAREREPRPRATRGASSSTRASRTRVDVLARFAATTRGARPATLAASTRHLRARPGEQRHPPPRDHERGVAHRCRRR